MSDMQEREQTLHFDVRYEPSDAIFIAEVVELQGCIAMGATEAELVANLKVAIADYLELFRDAAHVVVSDPEPPLVPDGEGLRHSEMQVLAGAC